MKALKDQTLVITGGSSGIGLATARLAVEAGANVVLVARSEDALEGVVRALGDHAAAVTADVASRNSMDGVVAQATARFGGFDTWVNAAGVDLWGRLVDVSEDDHRRLFETNFWGVVNGSLAAAEHLADRGGAIVNVGSIESDRAFPLQGMYAASKHAVKGFTDALRMELEVSDAPISLTMVKPGSIGTPLPDHAKTYFRHAPRLPEPIYGPEEAASAILTAAQRPIRDIYVGGQARLVASLARSPRFMDRLTERRFVQPQFADRPSDRPDNLHAGRSEGREVGSSSGPLSRSWYTRLATDRRVGPLAATLAVGTFAFALNRRNSGSRGSGHVHLAAHRI
jgi:NAD(P)-dependent dehydrogenase (short-subunit alcohol dehydrogenase family)